MKTLSRFLLALSFCIVVVSVVSPRASAQTNDEDRRKRIVLPVPANTNLPTLFLIGDSTVRNGQGKGDGGQWGWGDYLAKHFDTNKINIVNRAVGGLSSRTYLTQGHWERTLPFVKKGDFVMMQFGHNDNGSPTNPPPGRSAIKGFGDDTMEVIEPKSGKKEIVHTFGWYLKTYISQAREHGATPIVCTLIPRKTWKDGKIERSRESHAEWARQVAKSENAPCVDLNEIIGDKYDAVGPAKVEAYFADPHTHTSAAGAELNAQCVVEGLRSLKPNPVAAYLKEPTPPDTK